MAHCRERWSVHNSHDDDDDDIEDDHYQPQLIIPHIGSFEDDDLEKEQDEEDKGWSSPIVGTHDEYHESTTTTTTLPLEEDDDSHDQVLARKLAVIEKAQETLAHWKSELASAHSLQQHSAGMLEEVFHREVQHHASPMNHHPIDNSNSNTHHHHHVAGLRVSFDALHEDEEFQSFLKYLQNVQEEEQLTEDELLLHILSSSDAAQYLDFLKNDEHHDDDDTMIVDDSSTMILIDDNTGNKEVQPFSQRQEALSSLGHVVPSAIHHVQGNNRVIHDSPYVDDFSSEDEVDHHDTLLLEEPETESSMDALASTFVSEGDNDEEFTTSTESKRAVLDDQDAFTPFSLPKKVIVSTPAKDKSHRDKQTTATSAATATAGGSFLFSLSPVTCSSLVLLATYSLWTTTHRANIFFFWEVLLVMILVLMGIMGDRGTKLVQRYSPSPAISSILAMLTLTALGCYLEFQTQSLFALDFTAGLMLVVAALISRNKSFYSALLLGAYGIKLMVSLCSQHGQEYEHLKTMWSAPASGVHDTESLVVTMVYGMTTLAWGWIMLTPHLIGLTGDLQSSFRATSTHRAILALGTLLCVNGMLLQVRLISHQDTRLSNNDLWLLSLNHNRSGTTNSLASLLDLGELAFWIGIWVLTVSTVGRSLSYRKTVIAGVSMVFFILFSNHLRGSTFTQVPQSTCPQNLAVLEAASKTAFFRYDDVSAGNRLGLLQKCMQPPVPSVAKTVRRRRFRWLGRRNRSPGRDNPVVARKWQF